MYNLTRQDVALKLDISTRSVDRYIKSWKLRSKKKWKVVYINDNDVENLNWNPSTNWEVITPKEKSSKSENSTKVTTNNHDHWWLTEIYKDLRDQIEKKDKIIQELALKVGRSEEVANNSVSLIDFKKSQFLLEESKWHLNSKVSDLSKNNQQLEEDLKHEKTTNVILIGFTVLLLIVAWILWFIKI